VPSGDKAGIRYPESKEPKPPQNEGEPKETTAGKATLRSIAFL
jgi:hypothetical protein